MRPPPSPSPSGPDLRAPGLDRARRPWLPPLRAALALFAAGSCAGPLEDPARFLYLLDAGPAEADAGEPDAGADAGEPDAGPDAGSEDAGEADGGLDGGEPDAGPDAGSEDAGAADAGPQDAGAPDAGHPDAGHPDAGSPDAGHSDAGCNPVPGIFLPTCATGLCHGADTQQASLDLESPGLPGRLVGKAAVGGPGLVIDPAHPDSSVLYTKLSASPPFNFQMPLGLPPLTAAETACIRDWIHAAVGK